MNKDDILEDALNKGLKFSAQKHGVSVEEVIQIVKDFKVDIEDLCSCDKAAMEGHVTMCMFCDRSKNRIRL